MRISKALDEAAFANEFFVPQYVEQFYHLDQSVKQREVQAQKLTSDGITAEALRAIYQELYDKFEVQKQRKWVRLLPHRTVTGMHPQPVGFDLAVDNNLTGLEESYTGTVIILATGFETKLPQCLAPIMDKLELGDDGLLQLDQNFKVRWQGNADNSIYAVNAGLGSHGIADPQLSLAAWRSAKIINDLAQENCFDISESSNVMEWGAESKVTPFSAAELVSVA